MVTDEESTPVIEGDKVTVTRSSAVKRRILHVVTNVDAYQSDPTHRTGL